MTGLMQTRDEPLGLLSASLYRLRRLDSLLGAGLGTPESDHTSLQSLISDHALLEDVVRRTAGAHAEENRRVAANFVASHVAWGISAAPLALMLIERRSLAPDPASTFVRIGADGGWSDCLYEDPPLCVIAGDPLADHASTTVVEDVAGLHDWTRSRLVELLTPFVANLASIAGLTRRWLWAQVMSAWGSIIVWSAERAETPRAALSEAPAFLSGEQPAFAKRPSFYAIEHRGNDVVIMRRAACCLAYKLSDTHYCGTCPLISDDERNDRFCRESAAAEADEGER